jgi:hypothetical protein
VLVSQLPEINIRGYPGSRWRLRKYQIKKKHFTQKAEYSLFFPSLLSPLSSLSLLIACVYCCEKHKKKNLTHPIIPCHKSVVPNFFTNTLVQGTRRDHPEAFSSESALQCVKTGMVVGSG